LNNQSLFVYLTWIFVLVMWLFVYKTPYGFWLRASGEKPETLRTAGISPERMKWIASILCGIFCGLAGAHLSLGQLSGTFAENMSNSRGYIAFACVIFAAANPAKAYLAALMFGFFDAIGLRLQDYVSSDLTNIIPYLITVVMMVYVVVRAQQKKKNAGRQLAPQTK
jgi:simple sugar transport system permease protein